MKENRETVFQNKYALALGSVLRLIPLLLAACMVGARPLAPAVCVLLLWVPMERAGLPLVGFSYILLQDISVHFNRAESIAASALYTVAAMGLLLLYAALKNDGVKWDLRQLRAKTKPPRALYPALSVGAAALMTLYQCGGYFGLRAGGASVAALLRSYRNLGFHPNWRTVLYATIMMVVLITWPRKFKRFSKILPSGFVGIAAVTLLNLLLNPLPARSTVAELGIPWLPVLNRLPVSALSMLLIYAAWDEVPWKRLKACMLEQSLIERVLLCCVPMAMFCVDLVWVLAALALVWDGVCVARLLRAKRLRLAA